MTFNKNSRKRNSRAIIDKANSLNQEISNYKTRIDNTIGRLINDGEEDKTNRENFMEFLHLYLDHFEEIRYLDHYQWSDDNNAVNFTNTSKIISLRQYIPGWNEFYSDDVTFEDCSYLWNIFFPYSIYRSTDTINENCLWDNTELRAPNQQAAVPHPPSISEFQNTIIPLKSKPYIVAKDVIEECEKAKFTILNGKGSKTHDYSEIYNINDFTIVPYGKKVSYSKFNGKSSFGHNTYHVSTRDQFGTYQYARSLIVGNFRAGTIHFFCSDDKQAFGFGTVTSNYIQTVRVSLKPEYQTLDPDIPREFQEALYDSDNKYWNCIYYASIDFEFNYINGDSPVKLFGEVTDELANNVLRTYHTNLLSILNVAKENYQKALEDIRTDDNGKYDEYIKYLTNANYSTLEKAVTTNNTIINSVKDWINKRASDIFKTVRDELTAESYEGIISERMNKNYGSLYSWYAYDSLPIAEAYNVYKQKIQDGLYRFKSMLVAPVVVLDYTNEKNGGEEPVNPNFIDIDRERYQYYRMAGKSDDFVQNDIVYLLDDENPEFSARVTRVKDWVGSNNNQDVLLKRLYLDKSVSSVYDVSTLRVVKQI